MRDDMRGVKYGYDPDPHCDECGAEMEVDIGEDDNPSIRFQVSTCPNRADPTCPVCGDSGEIRHPRWGARNCPEPTMPCPNCQRGRLQSGLHAVRELS